MALYDIREAGTLFARARDRNDSQANFPDRVTAGENLVEAVVHAAQAAGLSVEGGHHAASVRHPGKGAAFVSLDDDRILVGRKGEPTHQIPLVYDPIKKRFEDLGDDPFLVPTPGEPRQRRSAVAAVAVKLIELIYGSGA